MKYESQIRKLTEENKDLQTENTAYEARIEESHQSILEAQTEQTKAEQCLVCIFIFAFIILFLCVFFLVFSILHHTRTQCRFLVKNAQKTHK